MKKLLIASAALAMVAGTAQAQSSVTVYGLIDLGYTTTEQQATVAGQTGRLKQSNTGNGDGGLATSRLGFRGVEDLGNGNKAKFQLEYDLVDAGTGGNGNTTTPGQATNANTVASGFGNRYSWVGLESKDMGEVRLGRQEQAIHSVVCNGSAGACNNVAGAVYSAGTSAVGAAGTIRNDNSIRPQQVFINRAITYITPKMNGFTGEFQTAKQSETDDRYTANAVTQSSSKETGYSLKYAAGKLSAGLAQAVSKTDTAGVTTENKQQALSASYDLGVAKLFALHAKNTAEANGVRGNDRKATEVGAQLPVGKSVLWASYYDGKLNIPGAVVSGDLNGYQLGARYDLSKRTALYAIYGAQEIDGNGGIQGVSLESTQTSIGVRHSF